MIRFFFVLSVFFIVGCSNVPNEPGYRASKTQLPLGQSSFAKYQAQTRTWLAANRHFITHQIEAELAANSPFELKAVPFLSQAMPPSLPPSLPLSLPPSRGVLLVHGLLDSPFSFVDIGKQLQGMGFTVRTVLLEGHGSKPADLLVTDANNWRQVIKEQVMLFKQDVDEVYLGGFSTGANLTTAYALEDDDIKGLVLFSPGFKSVNTKYDSLAPLAPLVSLFKPWFYTPSMQYHTNYVRYMTGPSNAYAQYYQTSQEVLTLLERQTFAKPAFIAVSQTDSIIDSSRTLALFERRFTHPSSRLMWFGDDPQSTDSRVLVLPGRVPAYNVSNFSHMGLLFAPENPYYGPNGTQRFCANGQSRAAFRRCLNHEPTWYSAYGYYESDKDHTRLTFNPWFIEMIDSIRQVFFKQP